MEKIFILKDDEKTADNPKTAVLWKKKEIKCKQNLLENRFWEYEKIKYELDIIFLWLKEKRKNRWIMLI